MYLQMSREERNRQIEVLASGFTVERYLRSNPGATSDEAWGWASRSWRTCVKDVADYMGLVDALEEAQAVAHLN